MGRKSKTAEKAVVLKIKGKVELPPDDIYRLDVLAAHLTLKRNRPISRSALVSELIQPHLRALVVQERGELPREEESAA